MNLAVPGAPAGVSIRRIRGGEGDAFRELRLRALADAPLAFGELLADARLRPDENWVHAARGFSRGPAGAIFVAIRDGRWVGMIGVRQSEERPGAMWIWGMWVDPEARRRGIAAALVRRTLGWAQRRGARTIRLGVFAENEDAISLYRGLGFRAHPMEPSDLFPGRYWGAMTRRLPG